VPTLVEIEEAQRPPSGAPTDKEFAPMYARRLMYLPAAALVAWGVLAASGIFITADSRAASSGAVDVGATVLPNLIIGGTCTTAPATTRSITPGGGQTDLLDATTCTVTQSVNNNPAGSTLHVESRRPTGYAFCKNSDTSVACGAVAEFTDSGGTAGLAVPIASGRFGIRVAAASTCGSGWTNGNVYDLRAANVAPGVGDPVCSHAGATTNTTTLGFVANAPALQEAGNYYATANFALAAN
jgi:hypothetical protein